MAAEFVQTVYDSVEHPNNIQQNQQSHHHHQSDKQQQMRQKCDICSLELSTVAELDVHLEQGCEGLIDIESNIIDCKPTVVDLNTDFHANDANAVANDFVDLIEKQSGRSTNALKRRKINEKSLKLPPKESQRQQQPKCIECDETFSTKSNLARHHRRKHNTRNGQEGKIVPKLASNCEVCGKLCENEIGLKIHRRTHSNERPFQCRECGQGFKENWALTRHYTRHTDELPFECWLCHRM